MKFPDWLPVYGDTSFRGACPIEDAELVTFFNQIRKTPWGHIALHIRNEGADSVQFRAKKKIEGMVVGAPDIVIPGRQTFMCELKRQDHTKSRFQKGQLEYLKSAQDAGAFVCVALGAKAALNAFFENSALHKRN